MLIPSPPCIWGFEFNRSGPRWPEEREWWGGTNLWSVKVRRAAEVPGGLWWLFSEFQSWSGPDTRCVPLVEKSWAVSLVGESALIWCMLWNKDMLITVERSRTGHLPTKTFKSCTIVSSFQLVGRDPADFHKVFNDNLPYTVCVCERACVCVCKGYLSTNVSTASSGIKL